MLQVGIGGSGKCSVAELAAYIEFCTFIKPSLKRNYTHADFRDDIKQGYIEAGVKGQKTVLFLNDSLIMKVGMFQSFFSSYPISSKDLTHQAPLLRMIDFQEP